MAIKTRSPKVHPSDPSSTQKPWWNRPLIGDKSLVERIKTLFFRKPVSADIINLHNVTLTKIENLTKRLRSLDEEKFGNPEFLAFVRISRMFEKNEGDYENLIDPMSTLSAGMTAHKSFSMLEQIEFTHRGLKFGEFYDFVNDLSVKRVDSATFCREIQSKTAQIFPSFNSTEGREALRRYAFHLEKIAQQQLSLNLLYAFKRMQFRSYNIFRVVADILKQLKRSDLLNFDRLSSQIIQHYDSFEKLGDLIGLRPEQQNVKTYTLLFRYLALKERHIRAYEQFMSLAAQFKLWRELQERIVLIRQEYPVTEYKIPRQFLVRIPGARIYEKYSPYLAD